MAVAKGIVTSPVAFQPPVSSSPRTEREHGPRVDELDDGKESAGQRANQGHEARRPNPSYSSLFISRTRYVSFFPFCDVLYLDLFFPTFLQ